MALSSSRLRRALSLSPSLLRHSLQLNSSKQISTLLLNPSLKSNLDAQKSKNPFVSHLQWFRFFRSSPVSLSTRRQIQGPQDDQEIGPDTILFEGCDYNHFLITYDFGKDEFGYLKQLSAEEMVETYVQTAAKVFGSVEEAKKRIYACSTTTYHGFQVECSEETSEKFKDIEGVVFILPDSYIDPVNKEYGGDKYINGTIIPRPPPIQYRNDRRPRNQRYDDRRQMQGETRNFDRPQYDSPQGPPSRQNYGPPQGPQDPRQNYGPPQGLRQNYGPPQGPTSQQNHAPPQGPPSQHIYAPPQGPPSQHNYGPHQGPPSQQHYGPPSQQNYGPPSQQNYAPQPKGPLSQQNYAPPHQAPLSQQNYRPTPQGPPHQQNYELHSSPPPRPNSEYPLHHQNYSMQQAPLLHQNHAQAQDLPHQQSIGHHQNYAPEQKYGQQDSPAGQQTYGLAQNVSSAASGGWDQHHGGSRDFHHIDNGYQGQKRFEGQGQNQSYMPTQGGNINPGLGGTPRQELGSPYNENYASDGHAARFSQSEPKNDIYVGRQVADQGKY